MDGTYHLDGLAPGVWEVTASLDDRHVFATATLEPESGDTTLDLDFATVGLNLTGEEEAWIEPRTSALAGRVVGPDGEPLGGARVVLEPRQGYLPAPSTTRSSPEGRFKLSRLTAGTYALTVLREGYATTSFELDLEVGERIDNLELMLSPGTEVVLEVDAVGVPRPEWVSVGDETDPWVAFHRVRLGTDGRARLDWLAAGERRLLVRAPGAAQVHVVARPPGPLRVTLVPQAVLEVEVPALVGGRLWTKLDLRDATGRLYPAVIEHGVYSGYGRALGLPAGAWTVEVTTPDGRRFTGTAVTAAGETSRVVLE